MALVSFQSGFIVVQIQDASTLLKKYMNNLKIEMIMKTNAIGMRKSKSQEKRTIYTKYTMCNERKMTIIITALVSFRSGFFGVRIQDASTLFKLYKMIVIFADCVPRGVSSHCSLGTSFISI